MNDSLKQDSNLRQITRLETEHRYSEAEALCRQILANSISLPARVSWQNRLAIILEAQARYDEALTCVETALSTLEAAKEQISLSTGVFLELATLANLGRIERILGHYARAEQTYLQAIHLAESQGLTHQPRWGNLVNELAILYKYWGKFDAAEQLYQSLLSVFIEQYGEHHVKLATIYHNLAGLEHSRRRYSAAEPLARQSYQLHVELLGEQHPKTIADGAALGSILHGLNRWDEAIALFEEAITFFEQQLGCEHYEVAINLNNLAASLQAKGELQQAEQAYRRALAIKQKLFGEEHPDIGISLNNLAVLLQQSGKTNQAKELFAQALTIFEQTLGTDHLNTRLCRENATSRSSTQSGLKEEFMSRQKQEKFTITTKPEKIRQDKPFIQIEGKLTEAQLEAIAAGIIAMN